jgi:DHA1 family bicyclomycin/chloramphenicol resistance-like MFS transporter
VAIVAMCFASIALAVDAMLPAMPQIAADLSPEAPQRVQLIIAAFLLGMGVGTLVVGPLSDAYGRKRVIAGGAVLFCLGALWSAQAQSLEALLIARVVMGLGGAAPRVVSLALLRDLYSGREMARITSFVMMVFTMVPAVAPLMGAAVLEVGSWRAIFFMLMAFSLLSSGWLMIRQPETLPMAARIPLRVGPLWASLRLVVSNRVVQRAVAVLSCVFGALFGTLTSVQQIFDQTLGMADSFPLWFMLVAVLGGTSTILNALLVVRLGMRRMVAAMLAVQLGVSSVMAAVALAGPMPEMLYLATVVFWIASVFFMVGITVGNINAIALEPMGHVAGMAASVTAAVSTVVGALLAIPIGLAFDGTPTPLALGIAGLCLVGLLITQRIERPAGA